MRRKHVIGYIATALVALGLGSAWAASTVKTTAVKTPASGAPAAAATRTVTVTGPTTTVTRTAANVVPKATTAISGSGVYQVGVDIKAGRYESKGPQSSGNCYWERDGSQGIITNDNTTGTALVTIDSADTYFKGDGCNDWTRR